MPSEPLVHAASVAYSYGERAALSNVSLSLDRGEMVALTGPNGSGKTTLLRIISGILRPDSGSVRLAGRTVNELRRRDVARLVTVVPQRLDSSVGFTGYQMVSMGRAPYTTLLGGQRAEDRRAVQEALAATDAEVLAEQRFNEMSGGEQQRIVLAMALAQETPILLLDEPTLHLDLAHQHGLLERLLALRRERNLAILAVMHDLNLSALYFDRMAVLKQGSLVADDAPSDVLARADVVSVFDTPVHIVSHPQTGVPQVLLRRSNPES